MKPQDFLTHLITFLKALDKNVSHHFGMWVYEGETKLSYGTPAGSWDAEKFVGFRFIDVRSRYNFIIRPVPEHNYLVIESIFGKGQLANLDLNRKRKYVLKDNKVNIFEDFTMTVGLGRRRTEEVRDHFYELGFNKSGLISSFDINNIDINSIIVDILNWASIREEVKRAIQEKKTISEKVREGTDEMSQDSGYTLLGIEGKSHSYRDKKDIEPVLGIKSIAKNLAEQISLLRDEEGQVIGIFGRWGRGKTFLLRELIKNLGFDYEARFQKYDKENKFHLVKIHAWKYKEEKAFWAYLYESIAEQYYMSSKFGKLGELFRIIHLNVNRMGIIKFLSYLIPLVLSFAWWILNNEIKGNIIGYFTGNKVNISNINNFHKALITVSPFALSFYLFSKNVFPKASKLFTTLSKKHSFKDELGFQAKVQDELRTLLNTWIRNKENTDHKRVIIVVDDLDRCELNNIIPIADALRIILEDPEIISRTIVVTLVDENILISAISKKYDHLGGNENERLNRSKEYMDKLFLTGIKLPELLDLEKLEVLNAITKDQVLHETPTTNFLNQTRKLSSERDYSGHIPSNKGQYQKIEDTFDPNSHKYQITEHEKVLLEKYILKLNNPTPRQIKIFYYRYLLLKLLDQSDEFDLNLKFEGDYFYEIALFALTLKQSTNDSSILLYSDNDQISQEIISIAGNKIELEDITKLKKLIEMVVPY